MATPRQLAANRANARKSTGPRTPEGKAAVAANGRRSRGPVTPEGIARSRWNALQHGLRARALIPEPLQGRESPAEFAALLAGLRDEFAPATPFEEILVESIAAAYWRLGRVQAAESRGIVTAQNLRRTDLECFAGPAAAGAALPGPADLLPEHITLPDLREAVILLRYEAHLERQIRRAYDLLTRVQRRRRAALPRDSAADPSPHPTPGCPPPGSMGDPGCSLAPPAGSARRAKPDSAERTKANPRCPPHAAGASRRRPPP